jgi:hypothetical protein
MLAGGKMSIENDRKRLSQKSAIQWLQRQIDLTEMVTVYASNTSAENNHAIFCALVPSKDIAKCLAKPSWTLIYGAGAPGAVEYHRGKRKRVKYLRFGNDEGIEPLVIGREFHGIRDDYEEISEEFRLFHGLYHDLKENKYFKITDGGSEELIAIAERNRVQIRLKEIRQFLAIKEMHLAIQFDFREDSQHTLGDLGQNPDGIGHRDELFCWDLDYGDFSGCGDRRSYSRLLGKMLIPPLSKDKSGFWGFAAEEPQKYIDFIIGVDKNGDEISFTSNPDRLANYFGANPRAPHYLTPVQFRKNVLDKYYHQPGKYSVEDSILRCGSLWLMALDNHHEDKIYAWLGDLGRDLPYEEQLHWRAHNIPPAGKMSETFFRRQILAEPTDSQRSEHQFSDRYHELENECDKWLGWRLLLALEVDDSHHFHNIRIPATDEQRDFDELVLGLAKILIDSLNEKQLNLLIPADNRDGIKGGISRLEAAFAARGVQGSEDYINFMRKLQNLRSSSSAHRKGSNYRKIAAEFGVDNQNLRSVFASILRQALGLLEFMVSVVRSGKLGDTEARNSGKIA